MPETTRNSQWYVQSRIRTVRISVHKPLADPELLALWPCRELRELELEIQGYPKNIIETDFISSMTSTSIKRITINRCAAFENLVEDAFWTQLDDTLIKLVERREYKLRLEVEFRGYWNVGERGFDRKAHLPKFVESGRMTVWDCQNELVYCSDGMSAPNLAPAAALGVSA